MSCAPMTWRRVVWEMIDLGHRRTEKTLNPVPNHFSCYSQQLDELPHVDGVGPVVGDLSNENFDQNLTYY